MGKAILRPIEEEETKYLNMTPDSLVDRPKTICETIRTIHHLISISDPDTKKILNLCRIAVAMAKRMNKRLIELKQEDNGQDWVFPQTERK